MTAHSLTRQLIEAHRAGLSERRGEEEWALGVDHVVFGMESAARIAVLLGGRTPERFPREIVLAGADHAAAIDRDELRRVARTLRAHGAHVTRPGSGSAEHVYRERFAAPGKLLVTAGGPAGASGALGVLAFAAHEIEVASVLTGAALHVRHPEVLGIRLAGGLATWVSGHDAALELARHLPRRSVAAVAEFAGPGLLELEPSDRMAIARECSSWEGWTALFHTDEGIRRYFRAQGREADWKSLGTADARYDRSLELDLSVVEPMIAPLGEADASRPVRHAMGGAVRRIVFGNGAGYADLARLATALAGKRVYEHTDLVIVPGSRQLADTAMASSLFDVLSGAGVRILGEDGARRLWPGEIRGGACLAFGMDGAPPAADGSRWYTASPETCTAAALTGRITDPRELECDYLSEGEPPLYARNGTPFLDPSPGDTESPRVQTTLSAPGRLEGALRGTVLAKLGDHVSATDILPRGARLAPLAADFDALAAHVLESAAPDFARRALHHRGGFLIAGTAFGGGPPREPAGVVLAVLGVRAVLARSFDPDFRRQLVHAGVLPLSLRIAADERGFQAGDELEIPGLPESLEPSKPLTVRNLTRGSQHALPHDLSALEVEVVVVGGLLPFADLALAARGART